MSSGELTIRIAVPACPVQIDGTIAGVPYLFGARYDKWEFFAGEDIEEIILHRGATGGFYRRGHYDPEGTGTGASWMDHAVAEDLVRRCAEEFTRDRDRSRNPS